MFVAVLCKASTVLQVEPPSLGNFTFLFPADSFTKAFASWILRHLRRKEQRLSCAWISIALKKLQISTVGSSSSSDIFSASEWNWIHWIWRIGENHLRPSLSHACTRPTAPVATSTSLSESSADLDKLQPSQSSSNHLWSVHKTWFYNAMNFLYSNPLIIMHQPISGIYCMTSFARGQTCSLRSWARAKSHKQASSSQKVHSCDTRQCVLVRLALSVSTSGGRRINTPIPQHKTGTLNQVTKFAAGRNCLGVQAQPVGSWCGGKAVNFFFVFLACLVLQKEDGIIGSSPKRFENEMSLDSETNC